MAMKEEIAQAVRDVFQSVDGQEARRRVKEWQGYFLMRSLAIGL
jgi:hypothetical protein